MILRRLKVARFRCLDDIDIRFADRVTAIVGDNGAGKTSILEAAYYLGRGRSFRQPRADRLIQHGQKSFQIYGEVAFRDRDHRVGVESGRAISRIRVDGEEQKSLSAIAERLVIEVIEPEIHTLVAEGPEKRRRYLDYGVFHVEPDYLQAWRRYRKTLKQRNAALRLGQSDDVLATWDSQLTDAAETVDSYRNGYVRMLAPAVEQTCGRLGLDHIEIVYRPGWDDALSMQEAIRSSRQRDREQKSTTVGPHRADLRITWSGRAAKQQVSRGQQKLLAAGLVLAQTALLSQVNDNQAVLLVDDPAAELDSKSLSRLMAAIMELPCQLIMTAINDDLKGLPPESTMFHVEHGQVRPG
ncbi:MAG: DNA replication/repair protein RecF [Pseudomonadota bacterium]